MPDKKKKGQPKGGIKPKGKAITDRELGKVSGGNLPGPIPRARNY